MLSSLLFMKEVEALSRRVKSICLEELLYVDDLALVSDKHSRAPNGD